MEFCIREALVTVLEINDFKKRGFIASEIFFINHIRYMNEMHTDSIDWLTQLPEWVTDWLTNLTSYITYISLRCSSPRNFQSSFGGIRIFSVSVLSSKAKLCCFCQILCRISTLHIINKHFPNCWHEEILSSIGMITVFFISVYVYSRFYLNI